MSLRADEVTTYRREGFLPGRQLIAADAAARLRDACLATCLVEQKDGAHRQASNRVKPYLLFDWAASLVRDPGVLDAVEALIGPDILVFHTTVWLKPGGSEGFVPWHQDATYFGLAPFEHVTAWVALTPSTLENGCVEVAPRTHLDGQRGHLDQRDERAMLSRGQTLNEAIDDSVAVPLIMRPGDVSFHHTLLAHRSRPNRTGSPRIGIGVSYIPAHVRHVGETRLSATLVRGEDRFGHFDPEPRPTTDNDPAAVAAHYDALNRFWVASESIPEMAHAH